MSQCSDARNVVCKHQRDALTRFVDFTDELAQRVGVTLSGATVDTSADATLAVSGIGVTTEDVTTVDEHGNSITIATGDAVQFKLTGGTAQPESAEPIRLTIEATLSDGDVVARGLLLRVQG